MRVASGLVVECVEDRECGRPLLDGEPRDRARLGIHQGEGGAQEVSDLLLLARLCLQRNVERKFCHRLLLLRQHHAISTGSRFGLRPAPADSIATTDGCLAMAHVAAITGVPAWKRR
jgi:hypothetical protein